MDSQGAGEQVFVCLIFHFFFGGGGGGRGREAGTEREWSQEIREAWGETRDGGNFNVLRPEELGVYTVKAVKVASTIILYRTCNAIKVTNPSKP